MRRSQLLALAAIVSVISGVEICPRNPSGVEIRCAFKCCESLEGSGKEHGYFCCDADDSPLVFTSNADSNSVQHDITRPERFVAYGTTFQVDYTLLVLGLIVSVVVSVILSLLCCLLCNGCWLHRRRNPQMYEHVNNSESSGFVPICCGFGIPLGTIVFSTHPPQFAPDGTYNGSTTSSLPSPRNRVRFNEDGTPRGVLKNGSNYSVNS